jgi:hypothetical protein
VEPMSTATRQVVEVKTLDAMAGDDPQIATRSFWEARGFVQIECIDPLPGRQPGNRRPFTWRPRLAMPNRGCRRLPCTPKGLG